MTAPFVSPPVPATATRSGLISTIAQIFGGTKTFLNGIKSAFVASDIGSSAADVLVKIGSTLSHAAVDVSAILFSVRTGIGGSETEILQLRKGASFLSPLTLFVPNVTNIPGITISGGSAGWGGFHWLPAVGGRVVFGAYGGSPGGVEAENRGLHFYQNANGFDASALFRFTSNSSAGVAAGVPVFDFRAPSNIKSGQRIASFSLDGTDAKLEISEIGMIMQDGGDSSSAAGAATINKPIGISAIASGATTCTITNSFCTANDFVMISLHGDVGVQTKPPYVVASAGSFTLNLQAAPASNVSFSWEIKKRV